MDRSDEERTEIEHDITAEHDEHSLVLTEPVQEDRVRMIKEKEEGQSLVQTIVMIIGAIILVVLLVLLARWIYHSVHNNDQSANDGTVQLPEPSSPSQPQTSQPKQSTTQPPSTQSTAGNTTGSSNKNGSTITNTGPGNVIAVFAGSTLAAAGLHYIVSLRRFNKYGD